MVLTQAGGSISSNGCPFKQAICAILYNSSNDPTTGITLPGDVPGGICICFNQLGAKRIASTARFLSSPNRRCDTPFTASTSTLASASLSVVARAVDDGRPKRALLASCARIPRSIACSSVDRVASSVIIIAVVADGGCRGPSRVADTARARTRDDQTSSWLQHSTRFRSVRRAHVVRTHREPRNERARRRRVHGSRRREPPPRTASVSEALARRRLCIQETNETRAALQLKSA